MDMIITKNEIMEEFSSYLTLMKKITEEESINYSISKEAKEIAESIKNNKFVILIVGETNSGKSTLINAFLRTNVLPMDVKQCTSAIIEISHGDQPELIITYADRRKEIVSTSTVEIKDSLKKGALKDEYRGIPVDLINNKLLIEKKGTISDNEIEEFYIEYEEENLYNLSLEEYKRRIYEYVQENKHNWQNIIISLELKWRLDEKYKNIVIVDSPGVHAIGGVGCITENYMKKADAILFVKSLRGQAIESTSFHKFLNEVMTSEHKDSIFLVMSGKADISKLDLGRILCEAEKIYGNINDENRIAVDSRIELYINECKNKSVEEMEKYFRKSEEDGTLFKVAENAWLKSQKNIKKFEKRMKELSNFEELRNTLDIFVTGIKKIAVGRLKEMLVSEYNGATEHIEEMIELSKLELEKLNEHARDTLTDQRKYEERVHNIKVARKEIEIRVEHLCRDIDSKIEDIFSIYQQKINYIEEGNLIFEMISPMKNFSKNKELKEFCLRVTEEMNYFIKEELESVIKIVEKAKDVERDFYNYLPEIRFEKLLVPLMDFDKFEEKREKYYYHEYNYYEAEMMSIRERIVKAKKISDNFKESIIEILSKCQNELETCEHELEEYHKLKAKMDRLIFFREVIIFNFGNLSEKILVDY